jgi:hypothetical protein
MDLASMLHKYKETLSMKKSLTEKDIKETIYFYSEVLGNVMVNHKDIEKIIEITKSNSLLI